MGAETHTLILAIAPFADAALVVGPLAARREAQVDERITFAGAAGVCEVITSLGLAESVVEAPISHGPTAVAGGARTLVRSATFLSKLRRSRYDDVVDLFPKVSSMAVAWLSAGGKASSSTSRYLDTFFKAKSAVHGSIDPVDRIAAMLGVDPDSVGLQLYADPENDRWIERALHATGYSGGPIVAAHTSGRWELSAYTEVIDRLRGAFGALPIAVDTPRESGYARQLAGALGGNVLGLSALAGGRFVAALARASLIVTDDTSVAYLSWLASVPVVLAVSASPYRLAPRAGLCVVDASSANSASSVYDAACELIGQHRTASLFTRR